MDTSLVCKLRETNGNIHVKGLKEIQVFTIEDAKRVAVFGAQHRKDAKRVAVFGAQHRKVCPALPSAAVCSVAGTMMNEVSSRSHAVFNMKLCRNRVGEKSDPFDPAQFHAKLSIVDLAGLKEAANINVSLMNQYLAKLSLKEAANINVSLMNLGRCLEELRWNQHNTGKMLHVVPFRHSKLTRLFQDHFMNGSKIYMIVAANPRKSDFDEALHALRYGAVARDIVVKKTMDTRKPAAKRPAAVKPVEEPVAEHWEEVQVDDLVAELECMRTQMYELQAKNSQLEDKVRDEFENSQLEDKVRDEVSEEMMKQMESMEQAFLVRLEDEGIATEQKLERKLHILSLTSMNLQAFCGTNLVRLEDERIATEQKLERKLHILSKEISRREELMNP
ncbi:P-loop containing nucleoside triphosphate hydrolase protein [Baffinella frigidus]|nr:P-loop containing nucleoside triphosphate hydrolase protein [Cryptophyta sp. CCMP2293]